MRDTNGQDVEQFAKGLFHTLLASLSLGDGLEGLEQELGELQVALAARARERGGDVVLQGHPVAPQPASSGMKKKYALSM